MSVAIAGGGIGGLAAALSLAGRGIASTVYERRKEHSETGAGIQLGPNATGVLSRLGVLDQVRAVASEPDALTIRDCRSGRVLARFPLGAWMQSRHGAPYLTLHRQDLHAALVSAALRDERIALQPGREVVSFENLASAVDVRFEDGASAIADALIGADGLWSMLRSQIAGGSEPQPIGKCAYRTIVPRSAVPDAIAANANDVHVWLSPGAHVVHYPVRSGAETAIVVVIDGAASQHGWGSAASGDALAASQVSSFTRSLRDLIFAAETWRMWPLQTLAPISRWVNGAAALLGDAAHPLTPFFAQGGALAIEDAAVLSEMLARGGSVAQRLADYEKARRARTERVVAASRANGRLFHLAGVSAFGRDTVLAVMPGDLMMRRYDWLYGWKP